MLLDALTFIAAFIAVGVLQFVVWIAVAELSRWNRRR